MVDCFITSHSPKTPEREYFFALNQVALHASGFRAKVIEKPMLERYFECERLATSDIYILSDDDVIPATQTTLNELVELMRQYPELSQLGLSWKRGLQQHEIRGWMLSEISPDIWEMDHVGGIMAIRKGTIRDLGYTTEYDTGIGDDRVMGRTARELGYKVALAKNLYFHHLGAGMSTVW